MERNNFTFEYEHSLIQNNPLPLLLRIIVIMLTSASFRLRKQRKDTVDCQIRSLIAEFPTKH